MRVMPGGTVPVPRDEAQERSLPARVPTAVHPDKEPSAHEVRQASVQINVALQSMSAKVQFVVDDAAGRTVVRVVDGETNELIRQIPSEETLAIAKSLDRLEGMLLHRKA